MKINSWILLFLVFVNALFAATKSKVLDHPTFELLTGKWDEKKERWRNFSEADLKDLERFVVNYQNKMPLIFFPMPHVHRIPRVVNFIWLGPNPFPKESVDNLKAWKELHPDWKLNFWTDSQDRPCPIAGMEKHLVDELNFTKLGPFLDKTKNYGEKADLIRYELIYQQGGVYSDHDVMPFRSFDALNNGFDFYVGLENPHVNEGTETKIFPCNCLFGARAYHPIIKETIELCASRWESVEKKYPEKDPKNNKTRVLNRTFHSFTLATKSSFNLQGNSDLVLPSSFFFGHKLFTEQTLDRLKAYGFVFARHDFAAHWTKDKKEKSKDKKEKSKKKSKKSKSK